jgi:hypothetical protein
VGGAARTARDGRYFGKPLVNLHKIPVVHVVPTTASWYQDADIFECLAAIRPYLSADAFTYGSSMGGYAVARFTDALGLRRGLALSPRYTVDPKIAPWSAAAHRRTDHITFRYDATRPRRRAHLWQLLDPEIDAEAKHARFIASEGPETTLHVPGAGHPVGPALAECGLLHPLIRDFLRGAETPTTFQAAIHSRLPQTSFALMQEADAHEGPSKLQMLARALEKNPVNPILRRRCARVLDALGRTRAAELMRATPRSPQDLPALRAALLGDV